MPDYTAGKARILLEPTARGFFIKSKAALRTELGGGQRLTQDVRLTADITGFRQDAEAKLRTMRNLAVRVGIRADLEPGFRENTKRKIDISLSGLQPTVSVNVRADLSAANREMRAWRTQQEARPLRIKVITDRPITGAVTNLARRGPGNTPLAGLNQPTVTPQVNMSGVQQGIARIKSTVQAPGNQPTVRPRVITNQLENDFGASLKRMQRNLAEAFRPRRTIGPSIRGIELLRPGVLSLASQGLPALTAALGQVTGAIVQMSGAALAAPGALAVLGVSVGTLALGLSGMSDALKALTQEQERSANQATADAGRFESAQNNMRNSLVDNQRAQEDLTRARKDARRELEDLHNEERSSYLTVADAALDLQEARNALAKGGFDGPLDRNRAIIRELRGREALSDALRRQKRDREDVDEADRKGINNSDQVRNATEALVRSNQQVAESLRAIQQESSGAASAQDKVKASLDKLSPATRDAVLTLFDLKDKALIPLRNVVSQNILEGFSQNLRTLANTDLPVVTRGLAGVGTGLQKNLTQLMGSLGTENSRGLLERIFGNTEEFHRRLTVAIDPAIRGIGRLVAAGTDAAPRLATAFGRVMTRFATFIETADREGRLDQWIDQGIDGLASLARSFGNILKTIGSIGKAFGGGLLQTIEHLTKRMSDFFASGRGQHALQTLIQMVRDDLEDWKPLLADMPHLFLAAMNGGRNAMHLILPIINTISSFLGAFPGLTSAILTGFIAWRALTPIFTVVSTGLHGIELALARIPGVAKNQVVPAIAGMSSTFGGVAPAAAKAEQAASGSMSRLGQSVAQKATSAIRGMTTALGATVSFLGGPWGVAIGAAVIAMAPLIQTHHDAADAADAQKDALDRLAGSLETVSGLAGAATRAQVTQALQDYQPQQGMHGGVFAAAASLGVNSEEVLAAVLPGAGQAGAQAGLNDRFREQLRGPVLDAIYGRGTVAGSGDRIKKAVNEAGMSDDEVLDAFLGDPAALEKFRSLRPTGVKVPDLGNAARAIQGNPQLAAAGLLLQAVNAQAPLTATAQNQGVQRSQIQAGGVTQFTPTGENFFKQWPSGAIPASDGTQTTVRVNGPIPANIAENLKQRGDSIEPAGPGQFTITLTEEDAAALTMLQPFTAGGPTPGGAGRGPTGGHIIEAHDEEWVLPKHARRALGDEWLWNVTRGHGIRSMQTGGAVDHEPGPGEPGYTPPGPYANWGGHYTPWAPGAAPFSGVFNKGIKLDTSTTSIEPPHYRSDQYEMGLTQGVVTPGESFPGGENPLIVGGRNQFSFDQYYQNLGLGSRIGAAPPAFQGGGPVPPIPPPPVPPAPPTPNVVTGQGSGQAPGPAVDPGGAPIPVGVSHSGGPGVAPGDPLDPATQLLTEPTPTVDAQGNLVSPQETPPNIGNAFQDMFLAPWGFKTGENGQPVPIGGGTAGTATKDPGEYLGEAAGGFFTSMGETLINGVLGFFGMSTDNKYFDALKKTLGFYTGKLGQGEDQTVDPATQALVNSGVEGFVQLTDPRTGETYLVPQESLPTTDTGGDTSGAVPAIAPGAELPEGVGGEGGLQVDTAALKRGVSATFPMITTIGGFREDPGYPNEHPAGKAIDVMLPGGAAAGTPRGEMLGNAIKDYGLQNAGSYGVEYAIWNGKMWYADGRVEPYTGPSPHTDHVHFHTSGGGYPTPQTQYVAPQGGITPLGFNDQGQLVTLDSGSPYATPGTTAGPVPTVVSGPGGAPAADSGTPPLVMGPADPGGAHNRPGSIRLAPRRGGPSSEGSAWGWGGGGGGRFGSATGPNRGGPSSGPQLADLDANGRPTAVIPGSGRGGPRRGTLPPLSPRFAGKAPPANYKGGNQATYNAVYKAFREAGFPDDQWDELVNIVNKESNWQPGVTNSIGAYGLFQFLGHKNDKYSGGYSSDPYSQGKAGMQYIRDRYKNPAAAWAFWQQHQWYDRGGLLKRGAAVIAHNDTAKDEVVMPKDAAVAARQIIDDVRGGKNQPTEPRVGPPPAPPGRSGVPVPPPMAKQLAPMIPPEADVPAALGPAPGPSPPPAGIGGTPIPSPQPQTVGAAPKSRQHNLPALSTGIKSGFDAAANLAASAISAAAAGGSMGMGGGAAAAPVSQMVSGLIKQGGKIAESAANVASSFASGFVEMGGTTANPYGVQLRSAQRPPPLASDQRRTHIGDNYFASMDEWRRQNQLQDAQDMQAGLARVR